MIFLLAYAPTAAKPAGADMGTAAALGLALSGSSNSAVALVATACFIAAAMTATGLDRRIALVVLSRVDASSNHSQRLCHPDAAVAFPDSPRVCQCHGAAGHPRADLLAVDELHDKAWLIYISEAKVIKA